MAGFTEGADTLVFFLNGRKVVEKNADPEQTLLQYLRNNKRLTGTKLGCSEGGCGACTVMLSRFDRHLQSILHYSVNACLAPVCSVYGLAVTTVEGIGERNAHLHPVQERLAKSHGTQCGFCTPGMVMSMYALLRNNHEPSMSELQSALEGNLCRCTGYRPILDGFRSFTKGFQCQLGDECCRSSKRSQPEPVTTETEECDEKCIAYDPSQEPIFPSELQLSDDLDTRPVVFRSERVTWYRPTSLPQLLQLKSDFPHAKLVNGNTEVGIEVKFKDMHYPVLVAPSGVPELQSVQHTSEGIQFGANISLTRFHQILAEATETLPEEKVRVFVAILEMLKWFAGDQIRNVATIGGNIMTASPISDLNPLFLAAACQLTLTSNGNGDRTVIMDEKFFTGYRKTLVSPDEILLTILVPFSGPDEYFSSYKQSQRRDDDIAIVNAGCRVVFKPGSDVVTQLALCYGGMAPTTVSAQLTARRLIGRTWDDSLLTLACDELASELLMPASVPGGMQTYRNTLALSFFFKFYLDVRAKLATNVEGLEMSRSHRSESATFSQQREPLQSTQLFENAPEGQLKVDAVGRPLPHLAAMMHTTGEAVFLDDMPPFKDELYLAVVLSSKAHARLLRVDPGPALLLDGVVDFIGHSDFPGSKYIGAGPVKDQHLIAIDKVTFQGQVIGAILARSQRIAQRAAKLVEIEYEELESVITIKQAIAANSYLVDEPLVIVNGDVRAALDVADYVLSGEVHVGGQEHFYMETHGCIAVPACEDGEMVVISATQDTAHVQRAVADALAVPHNRITCKVKRLGGGFGGKETAPALLAPIVAVAANKHKRAVRCILDRDEDMVMTGTRHPYYAVYKVGFTKQGQLQAVQVDLYSNCGSSLDLSMAVLKRSVFSLDNTYKLRSVLIRGFLCKTNLASNTAFRGFGAPQGAFVIEQIIEHVAASLDIHPSKIRELNLYKEGDITHINQQLVNCNVERCWREVIVQSDLLERRMQVEAFNKANRWRKRGICVMPAKFNVGFMESFLNQAAALVLVYLDGSVLISHAGIEMGQGLYTKMVQVASRVLQIETSRIHISETSSSVIPNVSPSAASMSSDLNGMAIKNACEKIMSALQPFRESNSKGCWEEWVNSAYVNLVPLSATGFYRSHYISYDLKTNQGLLFKYYSFSAAVTEVEIDCLTGDHVVLRTDIVMDVGKSLNPSIDIGQIEGAFVQGYGWLMLEEQRISPAGVLLTRGPGTYKIPSFGNSPLQMNVTLLKDSLNPHAVFSSKGIGEPPLTLSICVFLATRRAISAARGEVGLTGWFDLPAPATPEVIRMACVDEFTQRFPEAKEGSYQPWFIRLS